MPVLTLTGLENRKSVYRKIKKKKIKKSKLNKQQYLYVILLEGDNYYVGQTTDFQFRIRQHSTGRGASWTKAHQPVEVVEVIDLGTITKRHACYHENVKTEEYREVYGKDKVRGGRWCSPA